jgi:DNA-binding FadR family transcriptional regulator
MVPAASLPGAVRAPKTAELVAATLRRMIVDGQLKDGDFLPFETELMTHFQVSRPTLREAVRVLESDGLVEVRRGSRTGARVLVPGPEIVARPASLILELSGATLADVMTARVGIEPFAVRLLAQHGTEAAHAELARIIDAVPEAWAEGRLAAASANLHRRVVELSGNATLALVAGMLHEIAERHTASAVGQQKVSRGQFDKMMRSYHRLVDLVAARDGQQAEAHWRRHMENSAHALLTGYQDTKVRDVLR